VLEIAAGKAARERERLALVEARAGALPFAARPSIASSPRSSSII
jgi:hypothetical protein